MNLKKVQKNKQKKERKQDKQEVKIKYKRIKEKLTIRKVKDDNGKKE